MIPKSADDPQPDKSLWQTIKKELIDFYHFVTGENLEYLP